MPHSNSRSKQKEINSYFPSLSNAEKSPKKRKKRKSIGDAGHVVTIGIRDSGEDSDSDPVHLAPSSQTVIDIDDESEDDDMPMVQSPTRLQRPKATARLESHSEDSSSDDDVPLNLRTKKRKAVVLEDSDEAKPKKRRVLKKGLRPTAEEEDVMEDLDQDVIIESRLRKPAKQSAFSKNLERRRRQRLGLPSDPEESDDGESGSGNGSEDETSFKPIPGARKLGSPISVESDEASSGGTEDFVVEDDGDNSVAMELPLQFSMHRAQPLAVSFKVFFQLLVHIACQPSHLREIYVRERLSREDDTTLYLQNAVGQLRKHLSSIRDSQVASSLWKYNFRNALEVKPELTIIQIDPEPFCAACRRNSAISTQQAQLQGEPYRPLSFQPLKNVNDSTSEESSDESGSGSDSDESDGSNNNDDEENDDTSEAEPPQTFNLGQHCARRVALFHTLTHWEYALFQLVEEKVLKIETSNRKRRKKGNAKRIIDTEDPDNIVVYLENKKVIDSQWRLLETYIRQAGNIEARWAGEID
ncbi:hypothetical protein FS842_003388 [Serendipita sp. 407]|nr:hypothetical protein FS842_003388 [Serendipita sp. 407]